jgi:hypothetical protein
VDGAAVRHRVGDGDDRQSFPQRALERGGDVVVGPAQEHDSLQRLGARPRPAIRPLRRQRVERGGEARAGARAELCFERLEAAPQRAPAIERALAVPPRGLVHDRLHGGAPVDERALE